MSSWCVRSMDIPFQLYTSSRTTPPSPKMTTPTPPPTLSPSPTLDHMMEVCTHVLLTIESLTTSLVMNWFTAVSKTYLSCSMIQTSLCSAFPGVEIKGPVNPVQVGSQVEVVCNGSGAPPPEVMWLKDGAPLGNSSGPPPQTYMLVNPSTLRLTNVGSEDEGNYTCVVSNILGNNSASFMLVVGACNGGKVRRTFGG